MRDFITNLVARLQVEREHREMERRRARRHRDRVRHLARARDLGLERLDERAHRQLAALEDPAHGLELRLADVRPR